MTHFSGVNDCIQILNITASHAFRDRARNPRMQPMRVRHADIGVLAGAGAAWASGRLLESRMFGVGARDLRTLGLAVAVLMTIAFISNWVPARRAAANPIESLRNEKVK